MNMLFFYCLLTESREKSSLKLIKIPWMKNVIKIWLPVAERWDVLGQAGLIILTLILGGPLNIRGTVYL